MHPWETILRERLNQSKWDLPADDWEQLQARYTRLQRRRSFRNWALGVIPVAIAAGLALVFFLRKPDTIESLSSGRNEPQLAQSIVPDTGVEEKEAVSDRPVPIPEEYASPASAGKATALPSPSAPAATETAVPGDETLFPDGSEAAMTEPASEEPEASPTVPAVRKPAIPESRWEEGTPVPVRTQRRASLSTHGTLAQLEGSSAQAGRYVYADATSRLASILDETDIPSRSQLQKIAAFTQASDQKIGEIHHRPLELGLTAGIPLGRRWTAVSGIEYARYPSTFSYSASGTKNQEAHYLGIPLRLDYRLVDRERLHIYLGAGTLVDRGILARLDGERLPADGFGFSLVGAGGVQWDLNHLFGLYLEPRYSLFLSDTEGRLVTFRTESPARFSLAAGLRINL